jgi:hypothetical protein
MKIPPGVLLTAPVLAEIGPVLLDLVEDRYRRDGLPMPENVRREVGEAAEVGRRFRDAARKRSANVPAPVPVVDLGRSPGGASSVMRTAQAADRLGVCPREVRQLVARGRLHGDIVAGKLLVVEADVERLITERGK